MVRAVRHKGSGDMIGVDFMREQATRYRQLAADVTDSGLQSALIELAATYERVAEQLAEIPPERT